MSDLVDTRPPGDTGVALADSEQEQRRLAIRDTAKQHGAPLPRWLRNVELHAPR